MISFKSRKGQAFVWLGIMCIIIVMGLFYIILDQPIQKIKGQTQENYTGNQYEQPMKKIDTLWRYFLMVFLLSACAYGVILSMTRDG